MNNFQCAWQQRSGLQNGCCLEALPLSQSLAVSPAARRVAVQGDAEDLPFPTDSFDRYVSAGSIEYWPEPQRGICEVCYQFTLLVSVMLGSRCRLQAHEFLTESASACAGSVYCDHRLDSTNLLGT